MHRQILSHATVTERKNEETRQTGYATPRMFAVGSTVELIQGIFLTGHMHDFDNSYYRVGPHGEPSPGRGSLAGC